MRVSPFFVVSIRAMCAAVPDPAVALAAARAISDDSTRASALAELAPRLPEAERENALRDALAAAREVHDDYDRVRALAELAQRLPGTEREKVLRDALAAACGMPLDSSRSLALGYLAPYLPETLVPDALAAAESFERQLLR